VPVARVSSLGSAVDEARNAGVWIVGLDADASEDIWSSRLPEPPVALVLGGEGKGISRGVRGRCDGLARIPLSGALESLNVAVAGAIAMFEVARRGAQSDNL
jgi:23S rRNA (guanosine2251-2'-O)-methyltransferase